MEEIWKLIPGYESPTYEVSNLGRVRRSGGRQYAKVMNPVKGGYKGKYRLVRFWRDKKLVKSEYVHRLVAIHFIGEPPTTKHQVNHKDFDTTNNSADNLEWVNPKENMLHAAPRLEADLSFGFARKLTAEDVREIRRLVSESKMSHSAVGRLFGISRPNVHRIINRQTWKTLE